MPLARLALAAALAVAFLPMEPATAAPGPAGSVDARILHVEAAVDEAFRHHARLEAARHRREAARGRVRAWSGQANPILDVGVSAGGTNVGSRDEDLIVTQTLDLSRQRDARREAALRTLAASEAEYGTAAAELARDVRVAYVEAQAATHEAALAREAEERLRRLELAVRRRVDRGAAPRTAVLRAEVEALRAAQASQLAASREAVAFVRLRALIAWAGPTDPRLAPQIAAGTGAAEPPEPVAAALARRPELLALRARAEAQALEARALARARFPDVLLAGRRARVLTPQADLGFRAALQVPLWDFGTLGGAEQEAEALAAERQAQVRAEEARVRGEVLAAHARLRGARLALRAYQPGVLERSRELARKVQVGYEAGVYALFEVLDAQEALRLARLGQLQAARDLALAEIERDWATGRPVGLPQ